MKIKSRILLSLITAVTASLSLGACMGINQLGVRAANDLNCPEESVRISDIGAHAYRADGCGRVATYVCDNQSSGAIPDVRCTRESGASSGSR